MLEVYKSNKLNKEYIKKVCKYFSKNTDGGYYQLWKLILWITMIMFGLNKALSTYVPNHAVPVPGRQIEL